MTGRTIALYSLLAAAALGSWYASRERPVYDPSTIPVDTVHQGFYLKNARILGTAPTGELLYEIEADHAEQLDGDSVDFSNVRLFYAPGTEVPWTVTADNAKIRNDERRVFLSGHVRAVSSGSQDQPETEIRTQYLELDPDAFIAKTDERVQIRIGERSLTATGMLASLDEDRLELKSNVSGKFLP